MSSIEQPAEETLMTSKPATNTARSSFGVAFALVFCFGFGVALLFAAGTNWSKSCDQPLKNFLVGFGFTGIFASLVFLGLEIMRKPDVDDAESGVARFLSYLVVALMFATGVTGCVYYWDSENCDVLAAVAHRWTFAGVLAFLITAGLLASSMSGKFGAPAFALIGYGFGSLFQMLANAFKTMADVLSESGDVENKPPARGAAGDFAIYINHTTLIWFFAYILTQVIEEWNKYCDVALHDKMLAFAIYGIIMSYFNFLFEKFAGVKTRERLSPYFKYVWGANIIAFVIWGIVTAVTVFASTTCKDSAKNVYRLSFLMCCVFFVGCGFIGLGLCAGVLDFLCSGRLRFVVVVETGDEDDGDDEHKN